MTVEQQKHPRAVVVVPGYGCKLDDRLRSYLRQVAAAIQAEAPAVVITSGGRTARRTAPGISEARLMAEHLQQLLPDARNSWLLDEQARTTLENIRNVARIIDEVGAVDRVVILCDRTRAPKISMMARQLMRHAWELHPCELDRSPMHALAQRTIALAYDAVALRSARFERAGLVLKDLLIHIA